MRRQTKQGEYGLALARKRQARKEQRDAEERLPQTRDIDAALAGAFSDYLHERYSGRLDVMRRARSEMRHVVLHALRRLHRAGYDVEHPAFKARVWRRLGDRSEVVAPREPGVQC